MKMSNIHDNLKKILDEISLASEKADRAKDSVKLIAVSKTFPASDIQKAYNCGQRLFGENRVIELEGKTPVLPGDIQWHLIGHLQSNKSMKAVENASWIHSVESEKLVRHIEKAASPLDKKINILLEVNVSGEESKFGLHSFEDVLSCGLLAMEMPHIELMGLMTMAPFEAPEKVLHETFAGLREMRDKLEISLGKKLPELSMGMSGDYRIAIEEGATFVRIGTAIFGGR